MKKDQKEHHTVGGGEKPHDRHADAAENLCQKCDGDVAGHAEGGDQEHTEHAGQLTRKLDKAALRGSDLIDLFKVVGVVCLSETVGGAQQSAYDGKEKDRLFQFSGIFLRHGKHSFETGCFPIITQKNKM